MDTNRAERISPIIDIIAPDCVDQEKEELTREIRAYLCTLYDWFGRLDREGFLEPDSPETAEDGRFRVPNSHQ